VRIRIPLQITVVTSFILSILILFTSNLGHSQQSSNIQVVLADLQGLQFDEFIDASYKQILLRTPEMVTSMGLSDALGIRDDQLDNICPAYVEETYTLKDGIRTILESYDQSGLDYDQRVSYDSYLWLLSDWAAEREFMYHFYPVNHGFSRQNDLFMLFEDVHPLDTLENVEDYISRLTQVDDQFACLVQNLRESEVRGIIAPSQILQQAADGIRGIVAGSAVSLPFYTALEEKIEVLPGLSDVQKQDFLAEAIVAINSSVIPAYQSLVTELDMQVPRAPAMNGVWQLPDGDNFYTAMLRHHTTTELGAVEIHQKGREEVARIRAEIREAFDTLGYPSNETFAQLFGRVAQDGGIISAAEIVPFNEGLIEQAQEDITEVFDIAPKAEVEVIGSASGGFYVSGSLDGSRPGAYYIGNQNDSYRYWMRTIAYHETVPGHHFQVAIGNEQDVPLFTKGGSFFTAFVEGWALYAEYLAKELGWYDDDIYSELGRMQWELLRAARMVVDTGLHHYRWNRQQAIDYYIDAVGATTGQAAYQVDLYLYWPGYFTAYKTGMMKILELRQQAMDALGESFDIKVFHRAALLHNRLPLSLLERVIQDYIADPDHFSGKFVLNAGLNDAWYDPDTDGQGFFITVFPDLGAVSLAWFTYDTELPAEDATANLGDPGHRWLTAVGPVEGNQAVMEIEMTSGGLFDTATLIDRTDPPGSDGTIILTFTSCNSATVEYDIPSINKQGIVPIRRVANDNIAICEALSTD